MQFLLSWFLGDFDEGNNNDHNTLDSRHNTYTTTDSLPITPQARFESYCQRIEASDPTLKQLDWTHHYVHLSRLARALACGKTLQSFALKETLLGTATTEKQQLFRRGLRPNRSLVELDLSGNPLDNVAVTKCLQQSLEEHSTLRVLTLSRCRLQDASVEALGRMGVQLRELDLSKNSIQNWSALTGVLAENVFLKNLSLAGNQIGEGGWNDDGMHDTMMQMKQTPLALQSLNLSNNRLTSASAQGLSQVLSSSSSPSLFDNLGQLNLCCNSGLGDGGTAILATALVRIPKVDLTQCGITAKGVHQIARALDATRNGDANAIVSAQHTLRELNLARNLIQEQGVVALLECQSTIQVLNVRKTGIVSTQSISKALAHNTNLHWLLHDKIIKEPYYSRVEIAFWTELNRNGVRRYLQMETQHTNNNNKNGPRRIAWQYILEANNHSPSIMYYILRQKPDIFSTTPASNCIS